MTQPAAPSPFASHLFETVRAVEALRPPDPAKIANSDETKLLGPVEGVVEWTCAPTPAAEFGEPPTEKEQRTDPARKTRLWVVLPTRVPTVLEYHPHAAARVEAHDAHQPHGGRRRALRR